MEKFKISKKDANNLYSELVKEIKSKSSIIEINDEYRINSYQGLTYKHNGKVYMDIGSKELKNKFGKYINLDAFINKCITLFHESRHVQQMGIYNSDIAVTKEVALSYYVCRHNSEWYHHYYNKQLAEIDAEFYGINTLRSYLQRIYPQETDKLIVDYVNRRIETQGNMNTPYYITSDKPFSNFEDIQYAFECAANQSIAEPKPYDNVPNYLSSDDAAIRNILLYADELDFPIVFYKHGYFW